MRVAIISDTHNNTTNLKKVLDYCQKHKIKTLLHCGDLASAETLDFLNDNFDGEIYFTVGNMDVDYRTCAPFVNNRYKKTVLFQDCGKMKLGKRRVAFTHFPLRARELSRTGKYDFVFYGHTHKPWEEKTPEATMLNPGNVAGEIYPATFAVWNTSDGWFELVRIDSLK